MNKDKQIDIILDEIDQAFKHNASPFVKDNVSIRHNMVYAGLYKCCIEKV